MYLVVCRTQRHLPVPGDDGPGDSLVRKDETHSREEPWTQCYRYVLVASEMTKYVLHYTDRERICSVPFHVNIERIY